MTTATSADQVIQAATNLAPLIREYSDEAEQNLRLSTPVVDALTDAGVFRYLVPQSLGGGEGDPPGFYRMVEELGRVDGSTGWCGYVGSGGSFIGPNLSDEAAQPIWSDPRAVLAGGVFPFQPIVREAGGYRVNGQWSYVSGSTHATYLMASCILPSDESPGNEAQADPNLGFVVVPRDAAESPDTWDVLGLNGTGSHDVAIRSILVSELFTAQFRPGGPKGSHYQGQLYRFPFTGFFAQPMGAVALGIAQGAIDSVIDVAQSKVPVGGGARAPSTSARSSTSRLPRRSPRHRQRAPGSTKSCKRTGSWHKRAKSHSPRATCWHSPPLMPRRALARRSRSCTWPQEVRPTTTKARYRVPGATSTR